MRSFFELVGFEYKKLFKRKSTGISLFLILIVLGLLIITSVTSNRYWQSVDETSMIEGMVSDRESIRSKAEAYAWINKASAEYINDLPALSENEKEKHLEMLSQVKTPYANDQNSCGRYFHFDIFLQVVAMVLLIVIAICISPIFANEYYLKIDQLILSSKYGKSKAILAKIFTGITFSMGVSFVTLFGFLLSIIQIHDFSGANMAIQTINVYSTYPLTILQACLIAIAVIIFTALLFGIFTMLLSSLFKSTFSVIIVSLLLLFIPRLLNVSPETRLLYQLLQIFPAKAIQFANIYSTYLFEILELVFTPATFYIMFSTIGSLAIIPIIRYAFKNHQIG